jgi:hypothetical protein
MRLIDVVGILLVGVGSSLLLLGHHWFGLLWFWSGSIVMALGLAIVVKELRRRKLERDLRRGRGVGDWGNTDYHSGKSSSDGVDFGGGGGGDGGGD